MSDTSLKNLTKASPRLSDKNRPENYVEWLSDHGESPYAKDQTYRDAVARAQNAYAAADPRHGANAERLGKIGLTSSGYAGYLKRAAEQKRDRAIGLAESGQEERLADQRSGYADYLDKYEQSQQKGLASIVGKIRSFGMTDYYDAYNLAVESGLNHETAVAAATSGIAAALEKVRTDAARYVYSHSLSGDDARAYAKTVGLSDVDADALAEYARTLSASRISISTLVDKMTPTEYLEYLRSLEENKLFYSYDEIERIWNK